MRVNPRPEQPERKSSWSRQMSTASYPARTIVAAGAPGPIHDVVAGELTADGWRPLGAIAPSSDVLEIGSTIDPGQWIPAHDLPREALGFPTTIRHHAMQLRSREQNVML